MAGPLHLTLPTPGDELLAGLDYSGTGQSPPGLPLDRLAGPDTLRALGLPLGGQSAPSFLGSAEAQSWPLDFAEAGKPRLPSGWEDLVRQALKKRLKADRNLRLHLENCQRCGACADKCHLYLGTGDPLQMPVLRSELLRAFYRGEFTLAGRLLGLLPGPFREGRPDRALLGRWFHYFHQCSLCRRCAVFCPLGLDNSEISALGRDLLLELGLGREGILEPLRRTVRCGNHAGLGPIELKAELAGISRHVEELTGLQISIPLNEPGHEVLFVPPAAGYLSGPGRRNLTGCLMLLHEAGLDYTISTYASGVENYGAFANPSLREAVGLRMYSEAARLGCRWILAGDDGQMWRVLQQCLNAAPGYTLAEAHGLETPRNPATGTVFREAAACAVLHIDLLAADLVARRKIRLKPKRNLEFTATFHDSCHAARSLGLLEEPRQVLLAACADFQEMPEGTTREMTYCCGAGGGLGADPANAHGNEAGALREIRLRGGMARGLALRRAQREKGVNLLAASCSTCLTALPELAACWAPGVEVAGLYEILGNALAMRGEKRRRLSLAGELLPGVPQAAEEAPALPPPAAFAGGFLEPSVLEELSRLAALADENGGGKS